MIKIRSVAISPSSGLEVLQELERLLLQRRVAVPADHDLVDVPRVEVRLEGHEVEDGLLDDVAHVDGGGHVLGGRVHDLLHQEDPQLLGAVRVVVPAELPKGVLVVTDQSPDDGWGELLGHLSMKPPKRNV